MPTLGKTTDGASSSSQSVDRLMGSTGATAMPENGVLVSGHVRASVSGGVQSSLAKIIVYQTGGSGALYAISDEFTITGATPTWYTVPFSGAQAKTLTSGVVYALAIHAQDPGSQNWFVYRDNTVNLAFFVNDTYADGPPADLTGVTAQNGPLDLYITYSTGGGTSIPVVTHHLRQMGVA